MNEQQLKSIVKNAVKIESKFLMATKAFHLLGDISREEPELCSVNAQTDEYWVGSWVEGYGFFNVLFPRDTTRELTLDEIEKFNNSYIRIGSQPPIKLKVP